MVHCTYATCKKQFDTVKDMKRHKQLDPKHFYCFRCDVDCADDSELHVHKMVSSKHISCPACGLDFKSEGGREAHLRQDHPRDQSLPCPGCRMIFTRAYALVCHIDKNECKGITKKEFDEQRAKKQVLKAHFEAGISSDPFTLHRSVQVSGSVQVSEVASEAGGVSLPMEDYMPGSSTGEMDNSAISAHMAHHEERLSRIDSATQPGKMTNPERWHPLPGGQAVDTDALIDMTNQDETETHLVNAMQDTKIENTKPVSSTVPAGKAKSAVSHNTRPEWDKYSTTGAPFDSSWAGSGGGRAVSNVGSYFTDISAYDPMKFYDPFKERLVCPGDHCLREFKTPQDFNDHLLIHVGGAVRCPGCLRIFRNSTALVSHMESSTKRCKIGSSTNYNQLLREITGGLVGTEGHHNDGTIRYVTPRPDYW